MIDALHAAICERLGALPGVATCQPYAGELGDTQRATLRVPALLLALADLRVLPDPGTGEVAARAYWALFVCTRHAASAEARGAEAWALAEAVLLALRGQTWGLAGVSPALLETGVRTDDARVVPNWSLEDRTLAVREVRWSQSLRLGESEWTGGVAPSEVYLGIAPKIGAAHVDDYWRIDGVEDLPE